MTETPSPTPDTGPRVTREQVRELSTLRRAKAPRMVGGVAEGISRHLDIDPLIVRVVFAALSVFGGAGIALYVLTWVTIPEEGEYDSILSKPLRRDPYRVMLAGVAIAAVATIATMFGAISLSTPNPVPVLVISMIAIAAFALFSRRSDPMAAPQVPPMQQYPSGPAVGRAETAVGNEAHFSGASADGASTTAAFADDAASTAVLPENGDPTVVLPERGASSPEPTSPSGGGGGTTQWTPVPSPPPPPPRPPRPPRSHLFGITMACLAIAIGVLWVVDQSGHSINPGAYAATALSVIAVGLIVGAWWGRSRLLIVAGILATLATIVATIVGPGPYGERTYRPASAAALAPTYEMGAGRIVVHLEDIADPQNLTGRTLHITSRVGQVQLIVPTSIDVGVSAHVDHGDIRGLRGEQHFDEGEERVTAPAGDHDLSVDIELDFGQIVVRRVDCPSTTGTGGTATRNDTAITLTAEENANVAPACN